MTYEEYLKTEEWATKRAQRLQIDDGKCQCCGTSQNVQVHHFRYDNLGNESVWRDLVSLCDSCHLGVHRIMNRRTGKRLDGSYKRGWATTLPKGVRISLMERGLV